MRQIEPKYPPGMKWLVIVYPTNNRMMIGMVEKPQTGMRANTVVMKMIPPEMAHAGMIRGAWASASSIVKPKNRGITNVR